MLPFSELDADNPGNSPRLAQEFLSLTPAVLRAEETSLESLAEHRESVAAHTPLEAAHRAFVDRGVKFMAVLDGPRVIGICARGEIGFLMGSRFGFALYSKHTVGQHLMTHPMIVRADTPIRDVLVRAMARRGERFHEEAVLVDDQQRLLGLIPAEALAQVQSRLVAEQLKEMKEQQAALSDQNLELFRANNALRQSQGLYLGLFESHTLGVALVDRLGRIQAHNRRLRELLGLASASDCLVSLTAWVVENERPGFLALLRALAESDIAPVTREYTLSSPDRGLRLFRVSTGWIPETGQICACLGLTTDGTELKRQPEFDRQRPHLEWTPRDHP